MTFNYQYLFNFRKETTKYLKFQTISLMSHSLKLLEKNIDEQLHET